MSGFGASNRCTHILVTGHRCGSPALRGQYLCYFHARLMGRVTGRIDGADCMTHFENEESIQFALMSLLSRTLVGKIDLPRANFALKVLNRQRTPRNPDRLRRRRPRQSRRPPNRPRSRRLVRPREPGTVTIRREEKEKTGRTQ